MHSDGQPFVSAILVVGECRKRCQDALNALLAQTLIDRMEIVVVDVANTSEPDLVYPVQSPTRYFRKSPAMHWQEARILALQESRAEIIAFTEEHAYPEPRWAEAVLKAHRAGEWPIVGYAFRNANPDSYISRGGLISDYGRFMLPLESGVKGSTSGNNTAYKRGFLEEAMREFGTFPFPDFILQDYCVIKGLPLYVASDAVLYHENYENIRGLMAANFFYCHVMAGNRARFYKWSTARRLLYFCGTVFAAPPLKAWRLVVSFKGRPGLLTEFIKTFPVSLLTFFVSSVGEAIGYIYQIPEAEYRFTRWEINTLRARG